MLSRVRYTRRPQRHSIRLACQVVRERDFKLIASRTLDMSEVGMLVMPSLPVLTGESLIVSFMTPFSRAWIDAEATVARVVHGRRPEDDGIALGLSFEGLDAPTRALLYKDLRWMPAKHLGRGLRGVA